MRNKNGEGIGLEKETIENHKRYLERVNFYKSFGYDFEKERKFILEKAQPLSGSILEVGTGKGYLTLELAREGYSFTSIDISEEEQKLARLNIKYFGLDEKVDFRIENAEHPSFRDRSFDIIFSVNTIHHLTNPLKVINELIRIVTFEGKIILSDFSVEGLKIIDRIHASEGRKHEVGEIKLKDIEDYLSRKNFRFKKHRSEFQEILIASHQVI